MRKGSERVQYVSKGMQEGEMISRNEEMFPLIVHMGGGLPASGNPLPCPSLAQSQALQLTSWAVVSSSSLYLHPTVFPKPASYLCDYNDLLAKWGKEWVLQGGKAASVTKAWHLHKPQLLSL